MEKSPLFSGKKRMEKEKSSVKNVTHFVGIREKMKYTVQTEAKTI